MSLVLDVPVTRRILTSFIRDEITKIGLAKAVLGLSGGIDSALAAYLAVEALGPGNVHAFCMPYATSSPESERHARLVAERLGIPYAVIGITPMVDGYFSRMPDATNLRRGNMMARQRMTVLFDQSASLCALVLGTSNKTELLLGYGTLHGDMASAINPLGDLYKTQVWQLAEAIGVPQEIVSKRPSADLWAGQTDEDELGFSYRDVDRLLHEMIDRRATRAELLESGFDAAFVDAIYRRIQTSHFKRRLPLIAKLSNRTIDRDFRYSRDWGV